MRRAALTARSPRGLRRPLADLDAVINREDSLARLGSLARG